MLKGLKGLLNDEETVEIETEEFEKMNEDSKIDDSFNIEKKSVQVKGDRNIVRIYEPISKNGVMEMIDSIKRGELVIVNFEKLSDEESNSVYATLSGSVYSLDGVIKKISDKVIVCSPKEYTVDSESVH